MRPTDFRQRVDAFVAEPAIAVVGVSRSGSKFGNLACRTLADHGYRVYPIHPTAAAIDGRTCYQRFADLPEPVNAVLVVVPPARAAGVMDDAAAAGIHNVWLQQGAESPEALARGKALGLDVVSGTCVLMYAHPTGIHRVHRWVSDLLGTSA